MYPIVLVVWEDAVNHDIGKTWVEIEHFQWNPMIVETSGFLVYDGPEGMMITDSILQDFTGQKQQIPRGMIRSVTTLKAADENNG